VKPIARTIVESRQMVQAAEEFGVATTDTSSSNTNEAAHNLLHGEYREGWSLDA
jgi:hypothetical protein